MTKKVRVIQYGLGPIGAATARLAHERAGLELVGGVDIDPAKVGEDVGLNRRIGAFIHGDRCSGMGNMDDTAPGSNPGSRYDFLDL